MKHCAFLILLLVSGLFFSCADPKNQNKSAQYTTSLEGISVASYNKAWTGILSFDGVHTEETKLIRDNGGKFNIDIGTAKQGLKLILGKSLSSENVEGTFVAIIRTSSEASEVVDVRSLSITTVPSLHQDDKGRIFLSYKFETDMGAFISIENDKMIFSEWNG